MVKGRLCVTIFCRSILGGIMKIKGIVILLCLAMVAFMVPGYAGKTQKEGKAGRYVSQRVEQVADFREISVQDGVKVAFMQAAQTSLHVSGAQKWAQAVTVRVKQGVLEIGLAQSGIRPDKLKIAVTAPILNGVTLAGESEFTVHGALQTDHLKVMLSAQSEFSADSVTVPHLTVMVRDRAEADINRLDAGDVVAVADGRGEVELSGLAQQVRLENDGSGEIDAADLRAQTGEALVKGKGEISISAYETLAASVQGKGKIKYKGTPVSLRQSGNVRRIVQDLDD